MTEPIRHAVFLTAAQARLLRSLIADDAECNDGQWCEGCGCAMADPQHKPGCRYPQLAEVDRLIAATQKR